MYGNTRAILNRQHLSPRKSGEHMLMVIGCEELNLIWQFYVTL